MKKYILISAIALASIATVSCDKDTEGLTQITYYPDFTIVGPTNYVAEAGVPYVDPGCTATLDGVDVTDQIVITTSMNLQDPQPGLYTVTYTVVNADNIANSVSRNVIVADADDKASGFYTVGTDSNRNYGGTVYYYGGYPMYVVGDGEGNYEVSDLLGGFYQYFYGYGSSYVVEGSISIDSAGDISLDYGYCPGWGDYADSLTNGKFDAATGTISWLVTYAEMPFYVTATKDE